MNLKSIDLIWIVVSDLKQAIKFYTDTLGLELLEMHEHYGWAELQGINGGTRLGIAQKNPGANEGVEPGQNAVITLTVENLERAIAEMTKKGMKLLGTVQEIPGHVKLQTAQDNDGNRFQLVQNCHTDK